MDNIFYCIVKDVNGELSYYTGYYHICEIKGNIPAETKYISKALKVTFHEEAISICNILGEGWFAKEIEIY